MDIKKISKTFCRVLEDHEYYSYNSAVVEEIVETSIDRKAGLIALFRKHPNWDEDQLCIHFDHDIERKTNMGAIDEFLSWLETETRKQLEKTPRDTPDTWGRNYWYDTEKNPLNKIIYDYTVEESRYGGGMSLINCLGVIPKETIMPEFTADTNDWSGQNKSWYEKAVGAINAQNEKFNFRPGMKINRVFNKVCQFYGLDKLEGYDAAFARLSDGITPLKISRHTTISVNPIDFLLMSNGNSWQSCHYIGDNPEDSGCYSSGTISYMLGQDSFIVSIIDKEYPNDNLALAPKINRQVFGYNDHQLLQSRLYPQNCDSGATEIYKNLREMVEQIIADAEGEANRWVKVDNKNVYHNGTAYEDWNCFNTVHQYNLRNYAEGQTLDAIRLDEKPICISCGYTHWHEGNILCEDCYDAQKGVYCEDCGRRIYLDEETQGEDYLHDDSDDVYYCTDCRFECARCGGYHHRRYEVYISDIDETWCDECAEWYARRCVNCGEYCDKDNMLQDSDGNWYCKDCFDDCTAVCEKCGEVYATGEMEEIDGLWYCKSCAEEIEKKEESA